MTDGASLRPLEIAVAEPERQDAFLRFIGRIHTPWPERRDCPNRGNAEDGPPCRIELFPPWDRALEGVEGLEWLQVLYWMHLSRRDLVLQNPRFSDQLVGTFAIRSPVRPNPIALSDVRLLEVKGRELVVRGLDCVAGTPLLDIKPVTARER
ncbi:tRNA (N6-threonylcarbamoyladenosine(37)-N6)-methyltransferase TrmO [Paracoccus marinaquae]|uniref:tRNA (N6-threonylcarbamoyladenosine(37)-N6)-methyltransferase TrmO n=1 Tax=Paracoccus marinaquae TaxID=2841926 RepID=A0ABS6AH32_9RHOB|nr:tRNA (N6-threonylcarbamoyladenosine(37)-N6)-methyltransferase TrmO [Paracoccus marinaquae]MBU3029897.1 tRNA (N6-threonylcarbamoyladenosine(37)-N6)-methyltransferase TrmO [Paracoccus marinaquae]